MQCQWVNYDKLCNEPSSVIFSNKQFHFSYKSLNAPGEKIMFLWNFCHLFPVLVYDWNTTINNSSQFFRVFSRNPILQRGFIYQWGEGYFSDGGSSFLSGGCPMGSIGFDGGGRGAVSKKIVGWVGHPIIGNPNTELATPIFDCAHPKKSRSTFNLCKFVLLIF